MIKLKRSIATFCLLALVLFIQNTVFAQDEMMDILREELKYDMEELSKTEYPPYYMNFRVIETNSANVRASFGSIVSSNTDKIRTFIPQIRIGDYNFDNFHGMVNGVATSFFGGPEVVNIPLDNNKVALKQAIWNEVSKRYSFAIDQYAKLKADNKVSNKSDDKAPDFSKAKAETYYEAPLKAEDMSFDIKKYEDKMMKLSSLFTPYKEIIDCYANISFSTIRKYFVSSEGTTIAQNSRNCRIYIYGMVKTDEGMELPLSSSYYAYSPDGLPSDEVIEKDIKNMINTLLKMRVANTVEPYTGPAMLSGEASGVFFHEIFGHRVEGQRMKRDSDSQVFKRKIGQSVLPKHFSAIDDPTVNELGGADLNGYYVFDDQGVRGKKVDVVKDGVLTGFLMTRVPTDEFGESNGHARASDAYDPVSRQSNLIISSSKNMSEEQLRKQLLKEAKKQKLDYAYYFKEVNGGYTQTGRNSPNSFNVTPLETYKIFVDGRPDELVRGVDLIGTPLSMFSNIVEAGGKTEIFTGTCGAESGWVPVTACSPSIMVKKVELQRKGKSSSSLPILPRP